MMKTECQEILGLDIGFARDAGLINMHREGTMNYYYVDADKSCWHGLKALVDHVDAVVNKADNCGYPYFKEEI